MSPVHPDVDIVQNGRGGTIYYRELHHALTFGWEFALSPAVALLFGTPARGWDATYPWAAGRQAEIYDAVEREVVRQQVDGGSYALDLDDGVITILGPEAPPRARRPTRRRRSKAFRRFEASVPPPWQSWDEDATYDLQALAALRGEERAEATAMVTARDATWREVQALAVLDTPDAHRTLREATTHRLSVDTRLAAAEAVGQAHADQPALDMPAFVARQLRALHRPADGLARALRLAEAHDGPVVRQALLWASWNATACAPACAALLLRLTGAAPPPDAEPLLPQLDLHNSYFTRKRAFDTLCRLTGMTLDPSAPD